MNDIKAALIALVSGVIVMLNPIEDFVIGMLIVFTMNYLVGWMADAVTGGKWSWKKTLHFGMQCFVFFGIIVFLFVIGHFLHKNEEALVGVQYICLIAAWAYCKNTLRNLKDHVVIKGSTMATVVDILYYIISFELLEKLPMVKSYLEKKKEDGEVE